MDGRDAFLTMARERHFEFSSFRRAKFSSMAMLYELHTQSQDKFVYTCNNCKKNVETRYHCTTCDVSFHCLTITPEFFQILPRFFRHSRFFIKIYNKLFQIFSGCFKISSKSLLKFFHSFWNRTPKFSDNFSNFPQAPTISRNVFPYFPQTYLDFPEFHQNTAL